MLAFPISLSRGELIVGSVMKTIFSTANGGNLDCQKMTRRTEREALEPAKT